MHKPGGCATIILGLILCAAIGLAIETIWGKLLLACSVVVLLIGWFYHHPKLRGNEQNQRIVAVWLAGMLILAGGMIGYAHLGDKQQAEKAAQPKQEEKKILFDYIRDTYAPAVVPGSFYSKLTQLISGNYYKYRGSIPPLELYDMWVLAKPRLDKIVAEKEAKGCDMSQRWNYDLAVLLAQYPSYLERKERLASIRSESEDKTKENLTETVLKRMKTVPKQNENENEIDINASLDEI